MWLGRRDFFQRLASAAICAPVAVASAPEASKTQRYYINGRQVALKDYEQCNLIAFKLGHGIPHQWAPIS